MLADYTGLQAVRGPYLYVFAVVGSIVIQLTEQTLLSILTSIGELPQSICVDVLDLLTDWPFNELGYVVAQRCISTPTHDES